MRTTCSLIVLAPRTERPALAFCTTACARAGQSTPPCLKKRRSSAWTKASRSNAGTACSGSVSRAFQRLS